MKNSPNTPLVVCVSFIVVLHFFLWFYRFWEVFSWFCVACDCWDTECWKLRSDGWMVIDECCFDIRRDFVAVRFFLCVVLVARVIAHENNNRMKNKQTNKPTNVSENNRTANFWYLRYIAPRSHRKSVEDLKQKNWGRRSKHWFKKEKAKKLR